MTTNNSASLTSDQTTSLNYDHSVENNKNSNNNSCNNNDKDNGNDTIQLQQSSKTHRSSYRPRYQANNLSDRQPSALILAEEALSCPTLHIYYKKEGSKHKTLIVLPLLDELSPSDFISLLKHTFNCSAGIVTMDLNKGSSKGTSKASSTSSASAISGAATATATALSDVRKVQAISMTGNHCIAVKRFIASRGVYRSGDIHVHG